MSCNEDFFIREEDMLRKTLIKDIDKYDNIDYCIYRANLGSGNHKYDKENHLMLINVEDDIHNTFKKTYYALKLYKKIFKKMFKTYDYVLRINTSTYVNLELLNRFVNEVQPSGLNLWTSEIFSLNTKFCPYPLYAYGRGNALLLTNDIIELILKNGISLLYLKEYDDVAIGNILNTYHILNNENYLDYIHSWKHAWYNCIDNDNANNHKVSTYGNKNLDPSFIKNIMTMQLKNYKNREFEFDNMTNVHEAFTRLEYSEKELDDAIKDNVGYSNNPSVFIGSILGYIDYDKWMNASKQKLFDLQAKYYATDNIDKPYNKWL